jgi:signal transduction histidine kinase/DNA-binding response OmpR family regulator
VLTAESGEQGLSIAQNSEIDVFVVDNLLPGIDGASVVRRLRQQVRHRRTPSLLLTASDDPSQELTALEAGADAFVRKDGTIEVLLARLAAVLRSVGAPAEKAERGGRNAPSVLFVNPSAASIQQVARALAEEGFAVQTVNSPEIPEGEFECVVVNAAAVSRASGLVPELRARQVSRPPRIVILGESTNRSELLDAIALGADDYLPLSADEAVLAARLRAQLRRKQLEDENQLTRENLMRHRIELEAQRQIAAARNVLAEELRAARDLAERKAREAENLLAQNEAVFRSMAEGLIISDLDGNLMQVNQAALDIFKVKDSGELESLLRPAAGLYDMRALSGVPVPSAEWPLAQAARGVSVGNIELQFVRLDRDQAFIGSFNAVPVENRERDRILTALTVRDITAQKRSEDVLRRTEQLAVTGRLAASIAHEVNNPLSAVMNLLYLIEGQISSDSRAADLLSTAQKELRRIADITRQTLTFYRDSTKPVEVDICALVSEVAELLSERLGSMLVRLQSELNCSKHPIGFPGELRQVISNLVSNAIDASPRGQTVLIRVRASQLNGNGGVRITVADRGTGIPRAFYPDIFKPFSSLKGLHGTGLGLWVTQSIIARHDGRIHFRSRTQIPSGTVFSIFIPLSPVIQADRPDSFNSLFRDLGRELLTQASLKSLRVS